MYPVDQTSSLKSEYASMWDLVAWAAARHLTDVSPRKLLFIQQHWPPTGFFLCQMCTWQMFADNSYRRIIISRIYSPLNRATSLFSERARVCRSKADMSGIWSAFTGHSRITRTFKGMLTMFKEHLHLILRSNTFHCHGSVYKLRSLITWQIWCVTM